MSHAVNPGNGVGGLFSASPLALALALHAFVGDLISGAEMGENTQESCNVFLS